MHYNQLPRSINDLFEAGAKQFAFVKFTNATIPQKKHTGIDLLFYSERLCIDWLKGQGIIIKQ